MHLLAFDPFLCTQYIAYKNETQAGYSHLSATCILKRPTFNDGKKKSQGLETDATHRPDCCTRRHQPVEVIFVTAELEYFLTLEPNLLYCRNFLYHCQDKR